MEPITRNDFLKLYADFIANEGQVLRADKRKQLKSDLRRLTVEFAVPLDEIAKYMRVAMIAHREIQLGHHAIEAIMLYATVYKSKLNLDYIVQHYGQSTANIVEGLTKAYDLYDRHTAIETENFRKLLLSFARDVRVVMIMIVERLDVMRNLSSYSKNEQETIAREVSYLYAPLAHRMVCTQ